MMELGKEGKVRLIMVATFLTCLGLAAGITARPYLDGAATAETVMSYKSEGFNEATDRENAPAALLDEASTEVEERPDCEERSAEESGASTTIDWQGIEALNPDVIGWIRVPETRIDYPVVQASFEDPQYYLEHDLMRQNSPYGCPYLESSAANQGGLDAPFPILYGHHLINGLMFSDFAKFSSEAYALGHSAIIVETPEKTIRLAVIGANVVNADAELIQTSFSDLDELNEYIDTRLMESEVVIQDRPQGPYDQVFCFVTCSYGSDNERTLVYAVPESEEKAGE